MNTATLRNYRTHTVRLALVMALGFSLLYGFRVSSQAVFYADASDLLLAGTYGGLAHPPGYPLYIGLLHLLITAFPQVSPTVFGGWLSAVCMGTAVGLVTLALTGLIHRIGNRRLWFGEVMIVVVLWAMIPFQWTLATVPEIMPLALVLLLGLLICCLEPLQPRQPKPRYALGCGLLGVLAGLYHPLLIGIVGWIWLLWMGYWRASRKMWIISWMRGMVAGLLLTGLLYGFFAHQGSWYSWEIPKNALDWWHFWSRHIYTSSGSAIETLSRDWNVNHVMDGIFRWGKWWIVDQQGWMLTALAFGGGVVLLVQRKIRWLVMMTVPLLVYGPGVASYLKHPETYALAETAQWWGIALRERMFYLLPLLLLFPTSVLLAWMGTRRGKIALSIRIGMVAALGAVTFMLVSRFIWLSVPQNNAASVYMKQVLSALPINALLVVDDDDVFGLLYTQSILGFRPDIVTIPVGMVLLPDWWASNEQVFTHRGFSTDKASFISDLVFTATGTKRRVFLYGVDSGELEHLGVEGNPYYARPLGYTLEISTVPFKEIPAAEYGLSVQVAAIKTPSVDNWFKGFRTHLGTIHAQQAYFLSRMGFEKEALWHTTIARELFYREDSRQTVQAIFDEGTYRFKTYGSYLGIQPIKPILR